MSKILTFALAATVIAGTFAGCAQSKTQTSARRAPQASVDEQIVNETIAGGAVINNGYTIATSEADLKAKPDDVLYDVSGEPYRVVKHLGLNDEQ